MKKNTQISCPKCGHKFNVEDVLAHQIEEKYKEELNQKISEIESDYRGMKDSLSKKEQELKQKQSEMEEIIEEKLKMASEKRAKEIKKQVEEEFETRINSLSEENEAKKKQIQELKNTKIENQQLKRTIEEQKQNLELEFEQKMTDQLKIVSDEIRKRESERVEFKLKEKEELIESLKEKMDEMKRKAEQGSMQLQGEVQEIILEDLLKSLFVTDLIDEVGKGVRGADVIHTVSKNGCECGKILYESKRTKNFSYSWIEKLKNDAVGIKADICVIVTESMPDGIDKIGYEKGVWICTFSDVKGLALILRESLIAINAAYSAQSNKGEKTQMLYDYLTSNEFRLQLGAILEGYSHLQDSYIKEKRAMERIWKDREKQLERIVLNTNHFIGSIQGIAGNSIPEIKTIGNSQNLLED
jgi:hypothetical protein